MPCVAPTRLSDVVPGDCCLDGLVVDLACGNARGTAQTSNEEEAGVGTGERPSTMQKASTFEEHSPTRGLSLNGLACSKEDEDLWPANPWQAQADAHIMHLQSSLAQEVPAAPGVVLGAAFLRSCGPCGGPGAGPCGGPCGVAYGAGAVPPPLQQTAAVGYPFMAPTQPPSPEGLLQRIRELEGQVATLEETSAAQEWQLQEAQARLGGGHQGLSTSSCSGSSDEVEVLQRKNDFLSVLVSRFERKTMSLEEEIAGLTVALGNKLPAAAASASSASVASQTEVSQPSELEGQVALLEESLASKDREVKELKERLAEEEQLRRKTEAAVKGRTPQELAAEVESLQSRASFLSDLVTRFEDKTMGLERQAKALTASEQEAQEQLRRCRESQAEASAASAEAQQQLLEEAESASLALRDAKKEHNRRVQELLRQVQLLETRSRRDLEAKAQEDQKELKELKDLNAQLVERLSRERADHAETRQRLAESSREQGTLNARIESLSEQLFQLVELNDDLEEQLGATGK